MDLLLRNLLAQQLIAVEDHDARELARLGPVMAFDRIGPVGAAVQNKTLARTVCFSRFRFDVAERRLFDDATEVLLNPKALEVLAYLIENPRRIVPKEEILQRVWGPTAVTDDALVQRILDIRKVLSDNPKDPRFIRTHPKRGYEWIAAAEDTPPTSEPTTSRKRFVVPAAIGLLFALAAGTWFVVSFRKEQATSELRVRRLTALPGMEDYPAVDRTSGRIVFASSNQGSASNLWILDPATGKRNSFTSDNQNDSEPDWSPDGKWITFRSERDGGGLFARSIDGNVLRKVADFGHHPRWSPDSRKILFHTEGADGQIFIWNSGDARTEALRITGLNVTNKSFPVWNKTGDAVLFLGMAPAGPSVPGSVSLGHQVWRVPLSGGEPRLVTRGVGVVRDGGFDISPDGGSLAFIGIDRSLWTLAIHPRSGDPTARPQRLTLTTEEHQHPRFTAENEIVFSTVASPDSLWIIPRDASGRFEEKRMERLTRDGVLARNAALSPDGRKLAYITWSGERFEIWCVEIATRRSWRLSPVSGPSRVRPLWSRDGTVLVYRFLDGPNRQDVAGWLDESGENVVREQRIVPDQALTNSEFTVSHSGLVQVMTGSNSAVAPADLARITAMRPSMIQKAEDGRSFYFQAAIGGWFNVWRLDRTAGTIDQLTHFQGNPYLLSDMNREFSVVKQGLIVGLRENRSDLWMIR